MQGDGDDELLGGTGSDELIGGDGNDSMTGNDGDDTITGGDGTDTAYWSGDFADYSLDYDAGTGAITVTDTNAGDGDDGTDQVTGVENYVFNGVSYSHADILLAITNAPTDISISAVHGLDTTEPEASQTVVTGEIATFGGDSSVDHWEITHSGGDLVIDVFADGFSGGSLDTQMYLYRDNGGGSFTLVTSNDDGSLGEDGSTSGMDSHISEADLASGTYVLAIGSYPLSGTEALNTSDAYANDEFSGGPYQVTVTGHSTVGFATNPSGGGNWGDPDGNATIVSTTPGTGGMSAGTVVADVDGVTDADESDSHSFSLTDDAGGVFAIDSTTGEISVTGDPRSGSIYQDTITIRTTDSFGHTYDETLGLTLGTDGNDTLNGTSGNDVIYAADGVNVITGGAGDDTIVGGIATESPTASWQSFSNGANLQGTDGQDYFTWAPGAEDSATIRFENTAAAGDGDGIADYVRIENTVDGTWLQIGDFDLGVDQIVLSEAYTSVSTTANSGSVDYTITYANGNQQSFTLHHSGGSTDPAGVFTTVEPTFPATTGADRAVYSGQQADFDISYNAADGTYTITDTDTADGLDEGTDVLSGVETFTFDGIDVDASDFMGESTVAAGAFDYDTGYSVSHPTATSEGDGAANTLSDAGGSAQTVYARGGADTVTTGSGDDVVYGGSGNDTITADSGDDTLYGGTGNDSLSGEDGNDSFYFTSMEGDDTVVGGAGWTDIIELAGFGGDVTVTGSIVDGEGWTMVLDGGATVTGQTLDSIELSTDATGVITFDEGGTIDFTESSESASDRTHPQARVNRFFLAVP